MKFFENLKNVWVMFIGKIDAFLSISILGKEIKYPKREDIFLMVAILCGAFFYMFAPETSITGEGGIGIVILTFMMMYGVIVFSNKKLLEEIEFVKIWELIFGILIILSSYFLVGWIKGELGVGFRFGVANTVVFLAGLTIIFYGVRRLDVTWAFFVLLAALAVANMVFIGNSPIDIFAGETLAPLEAGWVSSLLNALGYNTYVSYGQYVSTVVFQNSPARIPIAGACTGIQGMTLYTTLTGGMMIGTNISYKKRAIFLAVGAGILFSLNFLRLVILSLVAYHYGMRTMYEVHEWLGGVIFLIFVFIFWIIIIGREIRKVNENVRSEGERESGNTHRGLSEEPRSEDGSRSSENKQETEDRGSN